MFGFGSGRIDDDDDEDDDDDDDSLLTYSFPSLVWTLDLTGWGKVKVDFWLIPEWLLGGPHGEQVFSSRGRGFHARYPYGRWSIHDGKGSHVERFAYGVWDAKGKVVN